MNAAHTPGPWELRNEYGMQGLVYPSSSDHPVCAVTGYFASAGQSEPNARLIAASPDLLALVMSANNGLTGSHTVAWQEAARAAIAKAVQA